MFGFPPAIATVVLGALALRRSESRGMAVAAIVIAGAMLALMIVWMAVEASRSPTRTPDGALMAFVSAPCCVLIPWNLRSCPALTKSIGRHRASPGFGREESFELSRPRYGSTGVTR